MLTRSGGNENPYQLHQELGDVMTKAATVVRHNDQLSASVRHGKRIGGAGGKLLAFGYRRSGRIRMWCTRRRLRDMFPIAKAILKGALARDECRGAHYKPEFEMAGLTSEDPGERRHQAERWCDAFEEKNRKWLKTTIADVQRARRPGAVVRRGRHVADPAATAAVWAGGGGSD